MYRTISIIPLLFASANCQAEKLFWGISAISQEVTQTISNGATTSKITEDATGVGVYADLYHQNKYRFNGTLSYVDFTDYSITSATASADYLIPINAQATFFLGGTAGGIDQAYSSGSLSDSAFSVLYGVQAGAIMLLGNKMMLEAGYRLKYTNLETEFSGTSITSTIDELNETYLSLIILM